MLKRMGHFEVLVYFSFKQVSNLYNLFSPFPAYKTPSQSERICHAGEVRVLGGKSQRNGIFVLRQRSVGAVKLQSWRILLEKHFEKETQRRSESLVYTMFVVHAFGVTLQWLTSVLVILQS